MLNLINTNCPYCGSDKMTADILIKITGTLLPDGKIIAKEHWTPETLTKEAIAESSSQDINGFCQECGKHCAFSWKYGFIKGYNVNDIVFLIEYGEILNKNDKKYQKYNVVYDKIRGYYDIDQHYTLEPKEEIKKLKRFYKIDENEDNYYIILTAQGKLIDFPEGFNINEAPEGCIYNTSNIIYYEGKENGKPFIIRGAKVKNALDKTGNKKEKEENNNK